MTDLIKKPSKEELKQMYSQDGRLRAEYFEAVNGRDYKPSDIRTHKDEILSYSPKEDVRIRKTVCKMGQSSFGGAFHSLIGLIEAYTGTVEANKSSFTPVLYFPSAKELNMVNIKSLDVRTVYPKCMIERFKMVEKSQETKSELQELILLHHSANIYFSPAEEFFYFFFDERFFQDFAVDSIQHLLPESKNIFVYKNLLAIKHKDISELKKYLTSQEYIDFLNNYALSFIDFSKGEEVILLKYQSSNKNLILGHRAPEYVDHLFKVSTNIQFVKAIKFGQNLYFYKDGLVYPQYALPLNDREISLQYYNSYKDVKSLSLDTPLGVLIKYTDEDWNLLISLQKKLDDISKTLEQFFMNSKTEDKLSFDKNFDHSLLQLMQK